MFLVKLGGKKNKKKRSTCFWLSHCVIWFVISLVLVRTGHVPFRTIPIPHHSHSILFQSCRSVPDCPSLVLVRATSTRVLCWSVPLRLQSCAGLCHFDLTESVSTWSYEQQESKRHRVDLTPEEISNRGLELWTYIKPKILIRLNNNLRTKIYGVLMVIGCNLILCSYFCRVLIAPALRLMTFTFVLC